MKLQIGLTGAKGWIGAQIWQYLKLKGCELTDLAQWTHSSEKRPGLRDCPRFDWILHFGASTSIEDSFNDPFGTYINNISSTMTVLEIAHRSRSKLLYMSSYVYGVPHYLPIDEQHPTNPTNPYMSSKLLGEKVCWEVCQQLDVPLIVFRAFNIFGPGLRRGRLVSDLILNVINQQPLEVNDPYPRRDYLYINDFCSLIDKVLSSKNGLRCVVNVGSGKAYSNLEVAQIIQKIIRPRPEIKILQKVRRNDIQDCSMTPEKVCQLFNWQPSFDFREALDDVIKVMRKAG